MENALGKIMDYDRYTETQIYTQNTSQLMLFNENERINVPVQNDF